MRIRESWKNRKMKDRQLKTINFYDTHALEWSTAHNGFEETSYWKDEMEIFHNLLPSGKILEIGSGSGKDASALMRLGFDYLGTDASGGFLQIAKKRNPGATFRKVSAQDLDFDQNTFDGFWTVATLLHIPKDEMGIVLKNIARVVKPGGIGFISLKAGAGEREDKETGRWFSYYSGKEFQKILDRNNMKVIKNGTRKGENGFWLIFFVRVEK